MQTAAEAFEPLADTADAGSASFAALSRRPSTTGLAAATAGGAIAIGRLKGFDIREQPLIGDVAAAQGRVLTARTTVPLQSAMVGAEVVVVFEGGDVEHPIVLGVLQQAAAASIQHPPHTVAQAHVDGDRLVLTAEREVVLRCGDASITLTRAGKVLIQGNYVSSRSRGYNKIKGAAIDIN